MTAYQPVTPLVSPFCPPPVYPKANSHPRVLLTQASLPRIRANMTNPEHAKMYEGYLKSINRVLDLSGDVFEYSEDSVVIGTITNKALAYLLWDDAEKGREAIDGILFVLRHLHVASRGDICRAYGEVMTAAARVYDWVYPLLSAEEREEIVSRCEYELGPKFEVGFPPERQGMVVGHGSEAQIFRDWLSLAIATYDEYPDIYNYVAGRIQQQAVPPRDFYFASGSHWQGSAYGPSRYRHDLTCALLFNIMTDGEFHIFNPVMHEAAITSLCNLRADGEPFREGDDWSDRAEKYIRGSYEANAFLASVLYRDPMLRDFALSLPGGVPIWSTIFLILDDPSIGRVDWKSSLPRVRYAKSPRGQYVAHHPSGASVYFKVGEVYSANHEYKDSGMFMIYYKGSLASAANCYQYVTASGERYSYGSKLDLQYNKQTVSSNCMLVYDPDEDVHEEWGNSGGQRADQVSNCECATLEAWMAKETFRWAKILAHADATDANGYLSYCLLSGDHTNAYSDKVTDYRRTSLAVAKSDPKRPLLVFVYDRLVTRDPAAEKTWQMHTMGKYTIEGSRAVTRHKDGGCLVCDSLLPEGAKLGVIGNEEERFIVNGVNLAEKCDPVKGADREDGRGRLTVSPTVPAEVDYFLHAMYVTDDGEPIDARAELIRGDGYVAASLLGTVALFPTETDGLSSFEIDLGAGAVLHATNLVPGLWSDGKRTYRVTEEGRNLVACGAQKVCFRRVCD